jgi:hypothetical protein
LVPEVVEQRLREKVEPAYKFHDATDALPPAAAGGKEKKRKKKI